MPSIRDPLLTFRTVFPKQFPDAAARVLHVYQQLRRFERAGEAQQQRLLSQQLNNLLIHARRFSPFWRDRLKAFPLSRGFDLGILQEIAPLTRGELQSEYLKLSAKFPQREALGVTEGSSSGSTGTPVRFERSTLLYVSLYQAVGMQCSAWHDIRQDLPLGVIGSRCKDKDRAPLGVPYRWLGPVAFGFERCTKRRSVAEIYEYCADKNPTYLQSGPTQLMALARYALDNQRSDLHPKVALTLGSLVTEEIRETVRAGLGAKIVDRYSCEETGYIAIQCPKHEHFHVVSPVTHVEIVDESGSPCPVGKPGRVLLTSMQSYAMPLVRYEIGDMAEWGPPCECGITLPVIKRLWGRTRHLITTPDGFKTYARIYARDFEDLPELLAYRFVLHQNETVYAQLKVQERSEELAAAVTKRVQTALRYSYAVQIRYVDEIDWGASWKQEYFSVSDEPAPTI